VRLRIIDRDRRGAPRSAHAPRIAGWRSPDANGWLGARHALDLPLHVQTSTRSGMGASPAAATTRALAND
jgi:nitrous oxide reductase accessory protein NosL